MIEVPVWVVIVVGIIMGLELVLLLLAFGIFFFGIRATRRRIARQARP